MKQESLRPQDILVLAKLLSYGGNRPPMARIAHDLSISASEVHAALKRLVNSRLVASHKEGNRPLIQPVQEFLLYGLKYAFPAKRGEVTRGMPTSYAAPPLSRHIDPGSDPPPVWPSPDGEKRGVSLQPLYRTVPVAARRDPFLYEFMALIDALRDGRARERKLAEKELIDRLQGQAR